MITLFSLHRLFIEHYMFGCTEQLSRSLGEFKCWAASVASKASPAEEKVSVRPVSREAQCLQRTLPAEIVQVSSQVCQICQNQFSASPGLPKNFSAFLPFFWTLQNRKNNKYYCFCDFTSWKKKTKYIDWIISIWFQSQNKCVI